MKIRNGFVSNSSSSSFIVDLKESKNCEVCGCPALTIDFIYEMCEGGYAESDIENIGAEAILSDVKDNWFLGSNEMADLSERIKLADNPIMISCDYSNTSLEYFLKNHKDINIIYSDKK